MESGLWGLFFSLSRFLSCFFFPARVKLFGRIDAIWQEVEELTCKATDWGLLFCRNIGGIKCAALGRWIFNEALLPAPLSTILFCVPVMWLPTNHIKTTHQPTKKKPRKTNTSPESERNTKHLSWASSSCWFWGGDISQTLSPHL